MVRKLSSLVGLAALLTLSACSPGEPAVAINDRVAAEDRTVAAAEGGGEEGGGGGGGEGPVVAWGGAAGLEYSLVPEALPVGAQTFELTCESLPHNVHLEGVDNDAIIVECPGEGAFTGGVELEAGTYTYYCSIAGHREAGMEGEVTAA